MRRSPRSILRPVLATALAGAAAAAIAGCGLDTTAAGGDIRVLVTQNFGTTQQGARLMPNAPGQVNAMRLLKDNFPVETTDDGHLVKSIGGVAGSTDDGPRTGWRYYINGLSSPKVATAQKVHDGDTLWLDRHELSASHSIRAIVGAFPEPFVHGFDGRRWPILLECVDPNGAVCNEVSDRLNDVGVLANKQVIGTGVGQETMRVFVGPWSRLRGDVVLRQLDEGPTVSGVYARFDQDGARLNLLDGGGKKVVRTLGAGTGFIFATRFAAQAPTWAITGTDDAGVMAAAKGLTQQRLSHHFAVAIAPGGRTVPAPVVGAP